MPTHPSTRPRTSGGSGGIYGYHTGDVFDPGAQNQVFEPQFALPILQLIGSGIYAGHTPRPVNPQVVFATGARTIAGLGGIISGQLITQPLNVPSEAE
jgi:hypothetical protein